MKTIRIGTRRSQLALWQAGHVAEKLRRVHGEVSVELVEIVSEGDRIQDLPLSSMGGKGLFLKELESALVSGDIDVAVHSMKDVTVNLPHGLHIPVVLEREDPRDVFVSNRHATLAHTPDGSRIGTCSLRRQCQLKARFPGLNMVNLRGNVNTRLSRLDDGDYDGVVLAAAGLKRLDLAHRITEFIDVETCLPAIGQGVLGIECRVDDAVMNDLIAPLGDADSWIRMQCERAANRRLASGCHAPVALYAELQDDMLTLRGRVGEPDGSRIIESSRSAPAGRNLELGVEVAEDLLSRGAADILQSFHDAG